MRKTKISYIVAIILSILLIILPIMAFPKKANKYTEAEHIQRVTERIEKKYMTDKFKYTSFSVYPLYNENDELGYFLVEFEPYWFVYVLIRDEQSKAFSWLGSSTSMYKLSSCSGKWSPYTIDETNSQPYPETDKRWEVDENGEKIVYSKSPYSIAKTEKEKKYLIQTVEKNELNNIIRQTNYYIPAIKTNEGFLNLISNTRFNSSSVLFKNSNATQCVSFIVKKYFDL